MRAKLLATTALASGILSAGVAQAQPVFNWSGAYVGAGIGLASGGSQTASVPDFSGPLASRLKSQYVNDGPSDFWCNPSCTLDGADGPLTDVLIPGISKMWDRPNGVTGSLYTGYGFQVQSSLYFGVEADISILSPERSSAGGGSVKDSGTIPFHSQSDAGSYAEDMSYNYSAMSSYNGSVGARWLGTVRGRIGFLPTPNFMVFGTGGLAYGQGGDFSGLITESVSTSFSPYGALNGSYSSTTVLNGTSHEVRLGWAAGGGFDWMVGDKVSLRFDYLHYDLGRTTIAVQGTQTVVVNAANDAHDSTTTTSTGTMGTVTKALGGDMVRFGITYKP